MRDSLAEVEIGAIDDPEVLKLNNDIKSDLGELNVSIESAEVLSVTPLSQRSQRAKNPLISVAVKLTYLDSDFNEE